MNWQEVVSNVNIYGLEETVNGTDYPISQEVSTGDSENMLNGIIVQFDLTFTNKAWVEAEHYQFFEFVRSQSPGRLITSLDPSSAYIDYVDSRIIAIMAEKTAAYNSLQDDIARLNKEGKDTTTLNDHAKQSYLELLYSNPAGFRLTARMNTNYRQLKTIYSLRRRNRLPEWQAFCDWIETLPGSEYLTRE
ncbi:MAG: hypothetical protein IJ225_03425 [Solobacterium sp.]|nr:hypothetical protein [Solobacterium sp.]